METAGWIFNVCNDDGPNFLYRNNHDGTFSEIGLEAGVAVDANGLEQGSMGITVGDYKHTGRFAFFVTNFSDEHDTLYEHVLPQMFVDVSIEAGISRFMGPYVSWGTGFFDYDNDGWPDLLVVNGHVYPQVDNVGLGMTYAQRMLLFHNAHDGAFAEVAAQSGGALMVPRVSRGAAFGDIDNDGSIDVVVENLDGKPTLLRNDGGRRNNWITIKLAGKGLNRDAIGAKVKVAAGDLVQWDEVHAGGSYLSSSDLRLHYGLGKRTHVDSIEIHWPDSQVESMSNVVVNHFIFVEQGKGITKTVGPRS